jgi:predicted ATPase
MEKQLAKIVNKGLEGQPQYVVLQVISTNKIFEFSQIKNIIEANNQSYSLRINDNDLSQPLIERILSHGQTVYITWDAYDNVTCHFNN